MAAPPAEPTGCANHLREEVGSSWCCSPWEDLGMEAQLLEAVEAIRPALQADGGDMRVVNLDQETGVVEIELMGACGGCPMSTMTLKAGIERILLDRVEGLTEVRVPGLDDQMMYDNEY